MWAPCLHALATFELLTHESEKLTFGSPSAVFSPRYPFHPLTYEGLQTLLPSRGLSLRVAVVENAALTSQPWPRLSISNWLTSLT